MEKYLGIKNCLYKRENRKAEVVKVIEENMQVICNLIAQEEYLVHSNRLVGLLRIDLKYRQGFKALTGGEYWLVKDLGDFLSLEEEEFFNLYEIIEEDNSKKEANMEKYIGVKSCTYLKTGSKMKALKVVRENTDHIYSFLGLGVR